MKDWENYFAGSLIYQDFADCSLGSVPVLTELELSENVQNANEVKIEKKSENVIIIDVLPKASAFMLLILTLVTTV